MIKSNDRFAQAHSRAFEGTYSIDPLTQIVTKRGQFSDNPLALPPYT